MFDEKTFNEIKSIATANGLDPNVLLAVAEVESAGVAFWKVGKVNKPAIRFEGHYFYARLAGVELSKAISEGLASKTVGGVKNPNSYAARYELLERAKKINEAAALESTSWGLGQVMGANFKALGYTTVQEMVAEADTVAGQVNLMVQFIFANNLDDELKGKQWAAFARQYNGSAYKKNAYDKKMAAAYKKYSQGNIVEIEKDEIRFMQHMLNAIVGTKLELDGINGAFTKVALKNWQLQANLKPDGIYGVISKAALEQAYKDLNTKKEQNIGAGVSGAGVATTAITEAAKQILPLGDVSNIFTYVFVGLIILGVVITLKTALFK